MKKNKIIDWGPAETQSHAVKEYLESLDNEGAPTTRASTSLTDPEARWTASRGKAQFAYSTNYMLDVQFGVIVDDEEDYYRCPAGKRLQRFRRAFKKPRTGITKDKTIIYSASKYDCDICDYKPRCCSNTDRRRIKRSIYEASRDIARAINQTDRFIKQSSAERKKVEMAFAHMKRNLNFHRLRLRGIKSANDECILNALYACMVASNTKQWDGPLLTYQHRCAKLRLSFQLTIKRSP